jgi:hypothetical protein
MFSNIICVLIGIVLASAFPPVGTFGSKVYSFIKGKFSKPPVA